MKIQNNGMANVSKEEMEVGVYQQVGIEDALAESAAVYQEVTVTEQPLEVPGGAIDEMESEKTDETIDNGQMDGGYNVSDAKDTGYEWMDIDDIVEDKELKAFLPKGSEQQNNELESSLSRDGQCSPIIITDEEKPRIVDGYRRLAILRNLGVMRIKTKRMSFKNDADIKYYMIITQLERRNMPAFERGMVLMQFEESFKAEGKENQKAAGGNKASRAVGAELPHATGRTSEKLAKLAGVSDGTMKKIRLIFHQATDEQKQRIIDGEASIDSIYKEIRPPKPKKVEFSPETEIVMAQEFEDAVNQKSESEVEEVTVTETDVTTEQESASEVRPESVAEPEPENNPAPGADVESSVAPEHAAEPEHGIAPVSETKAKSGVKATQKAKSAPKTVITSGDALALDSVLEKLFTLIPTMKISDSIVTELIMDKSSPEDAVQQYCDQANTAIQKFQQLRKSLMQVQKKIAGGTEK